ncbi:hypothetical protein TMS3_0104560 [Pseudomonas taeanensis MS-3]|uniref:Uncharacterized protein n=2 Tax=Pseudomonas taeanensis TaxID=574962 RepID=A0A0A1YPZ6_9PSED|nr:hypothetical protein TMS3_0104560 [Pseudomonas taeanensis MS-3]
MRFWEKWEKEQEELKAKGQYIPKPLEHLDFHDHFDHEHYRFATLSTRSNFWLYMKGGGKWMFLMLFVLSVPIHFMMASSSHQSLWFFTKRSLIEYYSWFLGVPLLCWALGSFVIRFLPKWWLRPSRGPLWEFNRRSGMVTLFDYDNNGAYKKHGSIGEIVAPFYEFDAYLSTHPDRQGLPMNFLYLAHRYRDIKFSLADLVPMDSLAEPHFALWDFLQNYMDTSRPLPDVPSLEKYRPLDPVTAAHDQRSGRNPRYWIDMDDDSFKTKLKDTLSRIGAIDTLSRPNLMARHVEYTD